MATPVALPVQAQSFSLSGAGSSIGDTVLNLKSFKDILGVNLTMTKFGSIGYGTIEPGNNTQEEQISFSGVTQNSDGTAQLTGVKHVLFITPYTESSGMTITHPGSVTFVISNTSAWENTIYTYANSIASGGTPAAQATIGITYLTQDPAVAGTPIAIGANTSYSGTAISTSNKAVDVGSLSTTVASGKVVRALDATGLIDTSFIPNIDAATKLTGIVPIANGGTGLSAVSYSSGVITRSMSAASGAVTTAHGLGVTPKRIRMTATYVVASTTGGFGVSSGAYNGTTNNTNWMYHADGVDGFGGTNTSQILHLEGESNVKQEAVATFDSTNITLTWTNTSGSTGNAYILWEAWGF